VRRRGRARSTRLAVVVTVVTAAVLAAACSDLNTSPSHVVSIFVDTLPYPSIVQNDTLRDTLGNVVPMKGIAYNLAGDSIPGGVQFSSLDANLLRITLGTNFAIAGDSAPSSVRVVGQAGSLQVTPFQVTIALRPDTVGTDSTTDTSGAPTSSDTAQFIRGFCNGPQSAQLVAWLRDRPSVGAAFLGVDNFIMKWAIIDPDSIAGNGSANDTSHFAYIVSSGFTPSIRDTTKGGGFSTRFLLFGGQAFKRFRVDTDTVHVTVQASTTYRHGAPVPGNVTVHITFVNPSKC
jgi:hypothetical protein